MKRETITKEQIRTLNQLGWDKKLYGNWTDNNNNWLECNFYLGDECYRYRIDCASFKEVEELRKELDP